MEVFLKVWPLHPWGPHLPLSSKETLDETIVCTVIYAVVYWMDVVNSENVSYPILALWVLKNNHTHTQEYGALKWSFCSSFIAIWLFIFIRFIYCDWIISNINRLNKLGFLKKWLRKKQKTNTLLIASKSLYASFHLRLICWYFWKLWFS